MPSRRPSRPGEDASGLRWGEECVVASPLAGALSRTLNCRDGLKAIEELTSPSLAAAGGIPRGRG